MSAGDPHGAAPILRAGPRGTAARGGLVLLHGRGGTAVDIAGLAGMIGAGDMAIAAPQAAGQSWWPTSFLAPLDALEPWLTSALGAVARAIATLEAEGIARGDIVLAGFSQGACLALEAAARGGGSLRAVLGFSGGLVGTAEVPGAAPEPALYGHRAKSLDYGSARLDGVPAYLGCHAQDPHIPAARIQDSAAALRALGAEVTFRLHPGAGHGLTEHDLAAARTILGR